MGGPRGGSGGGQPEAQAAPLGQSVTQAVATAANAAMAGGVADRTVMGAQPGGEMQMAPAEGAAGGAPSAVPPGAVSMLDQGAQTGGPAPTPGQSMLEPDGASGGPQTAAQAGAGADPLAHQKVGEEAVSWKSFDVEQGASGGPGGGPSAGGPELDLRVSKTGIFFSGGSAGAIRCHTVPNRL